MKFFIVFLLLGVALTMEIPSEDDALFDDMDDFDEPPSEDLDDGSDYTIEECKANYEECKKDASWIKKAGCYSVYRVCAFKARLPCRTACVDERNLCRQNGGSSFKCFMDAAKCVKACQ